MTWNWSERGGSTSRAFSQWSLADQDIRSYLRLSTLWSKSGYDALWKQAEESFEKVFDPYRHDGDEHVDMFEDSINGLWPHDYEWMLQASALKEAVTAYEVYAEKAVDEALDRFRWEIGGVAHKLRPKIGKGRDSAGWRELVEFHSFLGNDIAPPAVRKIRDLRHMLTHQRGEIRTDEQRLRFRDDMAEGGADDTTESFIGGNVLLGEPRVIAALDELAGSVRRADPTIWAIAWGSGQPPSLDSVPACAELIPDGEAVQ